MSVVVDRPTSYTREYQDRLIDKINTRITDKEKFFSLEFFPPRTPNGTCNLYEKCSRLSRGQPLFCDVTCNVSKEEVKDTTTNFVRVASNAQDITQCDTVLQMNGSQLTEESAQDLLKKAKNNGLSTVMVVNLNTTSSSDYDDFSCSADLVRFIRGQYGNDFNICVAGYPSYLPTRIKGTDIPYEQTFDHLVAEVKAGADFIITQMVFEASEFMDFMECCRDCGITVPIIPGILPIQSYGCIKQLRRYSKVKIPDKVLNILRPIQNNDAAVLKYGINLTVELCRMLLKSVLCCGLHFFTLNREVATTEILKQIGLWNEQPAIRRLPWGPDRSDIRQGEGIRPIFWACRKESYVYRTAEWEEFPNGRWGDSSLASFGQFRDYRLFYADGEDEKKKEEYKKMWGEQLDKVEDVNDIFVAFITGEVNRHKCKVTQIPWCDEELAAETRSLSSQLAEMNTNGFLTINSQPNVNAKASHDRIYGWGSPGGYVFQKAYLEFFCSEEDGNNMVDVLKRYPTVNYHFVNYSGTKNFTNTDSSSNAVTWGVFTGQLVLQPTVVDPAAFQFWKDEAFELWLEQWGRLYDDGSKSRDIIKNIHDTYFLVNLVDNDYVKGNCLFDVINDVISMRSTNILGTTEKDGGSKVKVSEVTEL